MVEFMMEYGKIMCHMEKDSSKAVMELYMKVTGKMVNMTAKVKKNNLMELIIVEYGKMERKMAKEPVIWQMINQHMWVILRIIK